MGLIIVVILNVAKQKSTSGLVMVTITVIHSSQKPEPTTMLTEQCGRYPHWAPAKPVQPHASGVPKGVFTACVYIIYTLRVYKLPAMQGHMRSGLLGSLQARLSGI
jgi:hypothetical protein